MFTGQWVRQGASHRAHGPQSPCNGIQKGRASASHLLGYSFLTYETAILEDDTMSPFSSYLQLYMSRYHSFLQLLLPFCPDPGSWPAPVPHQGVYSYSHKDSPNQICLGVSEAVAGAPELLAPELEGLGWLGQCRMCHQWQP